MKRCWNLFTYPVMDIKAAQAMLNRRASQGWRLEKVWMGVLAFFVPAENLVSYCIDWYDPNHEDGEDYRTLLADAGWQQVGQVRYWNLYEAPAGTDPIQTDGELEYRRFRKKALRRMAIGLIVPLICVAVLLLLSLLAVLKVNTLDWRFFVTFLTDTNTGAVLILLLPLLIFEGLLWLGRMLLRLRQWKWALRQGCPFPVPGCRSALLAEVYTLVGYLLTIPLIFAFLVDTMAGEISLAWLIGGIVGTLVALTMAEGPEYRRRRRYAMGTLACLLALLAVHFLPLSGAAARICMTPPLEGQSILPGRTNVENRETHATVLSARTEGWEWGPLTEDGSVDGAVYSEVWELPWPWLTKWVTGQYRANLGTSSQEELPGYENVWRAQYELSGGAYPIGSTGELWLIRRNNTVLWVETDMGPLGTQWLDDILARLEGDGV